MICREILDSRTLSQEQLDLALQNADDRRRRQAASMLHAQDYRVCLCADFLARRMLSDALGCSPAALEFSVAENGKPFLVGNALEFNLSHSGPYVACAVDKHPVGVDIECFRPVSAALKKRVFSPQELAFADGDERRFLQLWTLKEAFLKYTGAGLSGGLRRVSVVVGGALELPGLSFFSELSEAYAYSVVYQKTE